jgi:ubiquinone/menaquinone biosynthesis C-methylase UbiE
MDIKHSEIAAAYDRWAVSYDDDGNKTRDMAASVLRQSHLPLAGRAVIELGCGTGCNTEWLAQQASSIVALDFSEAMLHRARARVRSGRVRFINHDIRGTWPLATNSADVVMAMLVFEHVEHLRPAFAEAFRCLRPEGVLFICELHPDRQIQGRRAEFVNAGTGQLEQVTAFAHSVWEYVNVGLGSGFLPVQMDEWRDTGAEQNDLPRLFSAVLRVPMPGALG